jgi:hypothetical protein
LRPVALYKTEMDSCQGSSHVRLTVQWKKDVGVLLILMHHATSLSGDWKRAGWNVGVGVRHGQETFPKIYSVQPDTRTHAAPYYVRTGRSFPRGKAFSSLSTYSSTALCWSLAAFSVSLSMYSWQDSLDGESARRKATTYTQNNKNTE